MTDIRTFNLEAMRSIAREVFREERQSRDRRSQHPQLIQPYERRSVQFRNTSGEDIPPHAVMRVTGAEIRVGLPIITVAKPSTTFQRLYLVNGPNRVGSESQARGVGSWLDDEPGFVLYESGTPAVGESWGPKAGQWSLAKWRYGFTIQGAVDSDNTKVVAKQEEVNAFLGITDETIAVDADGACGLYDGNDADTSDTVADVVNRYATSIASGTKVDVVWRGGKWYIIAIRCS